MGVRTGLWRELPGTVHDVAQARGWHRDAVDAWLDSAQALGLVEARGPQPTYHGLPQDDVGDPPTEPSLAAPEMVEAGLTRRGPPHDPTWPWEPRGNPQLQEGFTQELGARDEAVGDVLQGAPRILEVGGGTGAWVHEVVQAVPRARFTIHEPRAVVRSHLRELREREGWGDRVNVEEVRAESLTYQGGFDLVHLGQVLPQVPSVVTVLGRAHHALDRGGVLAVSEFLLDDAADPASPGNRTVRARRFLRHVRGETTLSKQHLWRLMVEAGFQRIRFHPLGDTGAWFGVAES